MYGTFVWQEQERSRHYSCKQEAIQFLVCLWEPEGRIQCLGVVLLSLVHEEYHFSWGFVALITRDCLFCLVHGRLPSRTTSFVVVLMQFDAADPYVLSVQLESAVRDPCMLHWSTQSIILVLLAGRSFASVYHSVFDCFFFCATTVPHVAHV